MSNTNEKADTAYFIIKDTSLPDSMAFDFSSVKVSGIDEKDYTIEQSGNGWILKSKGDMHFHMERQSQLNMMQKH